jgi:hypothetical protein
MKKISLILSIAIIPLICFSQVTTDSTDYKSSTTSTSRLGVALGGSLEYTTPQKYGAALNFTIGKNTTEIHMQDDIPIRTIQGIKGLNLEAGLLRGGYRFGAYYGNFGWSIIGVVGTRVGVVYLKNNSHSNVLKSEDLIGIEAELFTIYKFKVGILKAVESDKYIPSLGFGFGIGPFF